MCSHFEALHPQELYLKAFDVAPPPAQGELDMWPKYTGVFIRKPPETDPHDEAVPKREALNGRWGLVPGRTRPDGAEKQLKLSTFNARDDRVSKSFTFGEAWRRGQHCIIPVEAFYEPDWRTGKAIATRFTRADGQLMGIAGLWDTWNQPGKGPLLSFTMLTINAADHRLLRDYHRPADEKRMIVLLPESRYQEWLESPAEKSVEFLQQYPADRLVATPKLSTAKGETHQLI